MITGLTYNFLPFMVLPLYASLEKVDPRLIEAGGDLYASPFTDLPAGHAAAGDARAWSPARCSPSSRRPATTSTPSCWGTRRTRMIGNDIQDLFAASVLPTAAALSVTLMVAIIAMVLVYVRRAGTEELV